MKKKHFLYFLGPLVLDALFFGFMYLAYKFPVIVDWLPIANTSITKEGFHRFLFGLLFIGIVIVIVLIYRKEYKNAIFFILGSLATIFIYFGGLICILSGLCGGPGIGI